MPAILAIVVGLAIVIGVSGTYLIMTKVSDFKQEPKESIYKTDEDGGKGKGGFPGGGKGGPGGRGPAGTADKGGDPQGGAQ